MSKRNLPPVYLCRDCQASQDWPKLCARHRAFFAQIGAQRALPMEER